MTNIGAITIKQKKEDKTVDEYLVFVAEGMGSNPQTKEDNAQKLFHIGDYLVMGTGSGQHIINSAIELSKRNHSSVTELQNDLIAITDRIELNPEEWLGFIVGGKSDDGLKIWHTIRSGILIDNNGKPRLDLQGQPIKAKESYQVPSAFDGSGSRFVGLYRQGLDKAGKPVPNILDNLADGLVLMYEQGLEGATDRSVNDKLQFGIISKNGVSTLYHPDTDLMKYIDFNQLQVYLESMTGVKMERYSPGMSPRKNEVLSEKYSVFEKVLRSVYSSLNFDLKDLARERHDFTSVSEHYLNDRVPIGLLKRSKISTLEAKSHVTEGANAIVTRGLESLMSYRNGFEERQKIIEQKAVGYVRE